MTFKNIYSHVLSSQLWHRTFLSYKRVPSSPFAVNSLLYPPGLWKHYVFYHYNFSLSRILQKCNPFSIFSFIYGFYHLSECYCYVFRNSFLLLCSCIPFYGYTTICLTRHLLWMWGLFPDFDCYTAAINIHVQIFVWTYIFISLGKSIEMELMGLTVMVPSSLPN